MLYTLLTFSDQLPTAMLRDALEQQLVALEGALAQWHEGEAAKVQTGGLPPWGQHCSAMGSATWKRTLGWYGTCLHCCCVQRSRQTRSHITYKDTLCK